MTRTIVGAVAVAVVFPFGPGFAGAQAPPLVSGPPELCGSGSTQSSRLDLEVARLYGRRVPSPRWLVVTVVEVHLLDPITLEVLTVYRDGDMWVGERFVDRCDILAIAARGATGAVIELALFPRTFDGITTESRGQWAREVRREILFVIESPKVICAALDDCAAPLLNEVDRP